MTSRILRLLLVLATLALLSSAVVPTVHAHASSEPALYNAECSLAQLATRAAGAPLPSPSDAQEPGVVGQEVAAAIPSELPAVVPLPFASRAPPSR